MLHVNAVPKCIYCAAGDVPHPGMNGSGNPRPSHTIQHLTYTKEETCTNPDYVVKWHPYVPDKDRG